MEQIGQFFDKSERRNNRTLAERNERSRGGKKKRRRRKREKKQLNPSASREKQLNPFRSIEPFDLFEGKEKRRREEGERGRINLIPTADLSSLIYPRKLGFIMGSEEAKDSLKGVDWKTVGGSVGNEPNVGPIAKKRFPKKMRQVPDYYFLPRRSIPSAIAIYGSIIAAGVGAGMLVEVWINKKIKEDGGVLWEFDK